MKRPIEADYTSHVAYTRALEAYCDWLMKSEQEPMAKYIGEGSEGSLVQLYEDVKKGTDFYTTPQKQEARNFCPRCGKRTPDLAAVHTCTPPRGLENT